MLENRLTRRGALQPEDVDVAMREVRRALLEADVSLDVARAFIERVREKAVGEIVPGGVVEVLVDNPSSVEALPPMCNELNATHLETIKDPACWRVYIRKD